MSDYIPSEVLIEILLRLPAKSVAEFRFVCKSWYSLIMDPKFISMYTQFAIKQRNDDNNPPLIMIKQYSIANTEWTFTLHRDDESFGKCHQQLDLPSQISGIPFNIVGTCHGLSCFVTSGSYLPKPLILWNPSIGVSVTLPVEQITRSCIYRRIYGFGFDPKSNDYKVVSIEYQLKNWSTCRYGLGVYSTPIPIEVKIFALSEGSWRSIIAKAAPPYVIDAECSMASVNGAVHWIAHYREVVDVRPRKWVVAAFSVGDELFTELKMPNGLMQEVEVVGSHKKLFIGVFGQLLSLMQYYTQWENTPFHEGCCIWVMREYGVAESWTKQFKIDLHLGIKCVVGSRRNGEILLVTRHNGELVSYDPTSQRINRLGTYGDIGSVAYYMECLALLNGKNGGFGQSSSYNAITYKR